MLARIEVKVLKRVKYHGIEVYVPIVNTNEGKGEGVITCDNWMSLQLTLLSYYECA